MWSFERRRLLVTAALGVLAGCGFRLRQPATLTFPSIALTGFAPRSPMAETLRGLLVQQVQVLDAPARASVVLQVLDDRQEKSVVASTAAAQVRDTQLRVKFAFRAHRPDGRELIPKVELMASFDMSYRETDALAKEYEEAELMNEMRSDLAMQVLRRLASVQV
jgi:LPS-assembly lipoprotein